MKLNSKLNNTSIRKYKAYLSSLGLSDSTINRKLSSLSLFKQFLKDSGYIKDKKKTVKAIQASFKPINNLFNSSFLARYLLLATLLIIISGLGYGIYYQTILKAKRDLAYSTTVDPTRPTRQLSFQGRLTDSVGTPITSSTGIQFKLFTLGAGGTELYNSGTGDTIAPDDNGIFSVLIGGTHGSEIPTSVFSENAEVWLEITMDPAGVPEVMDQRQQIATVAYALNADTLQGMPPASPATANTVLVLNNDGNLEIGYTDPSIISHAGTFGIEGRAMLLKATDGYGGNITINPDADGIINFITEGTSPSVGGFLNLTNANLASGNLINAQIENDNRGYDFLNLSNFDVGTTNLTTRLSIDAYGNTNIGATLTAVNISIGSTLITSTASELNYLAGLTTTTGSIYYGNGSGITDLAPTTSGYILQTNDTGSAPSWISPASIGTSYPPTNALQYIGGSIGLGGTLIQNTQIGTSSFSLSFLGLGNTQSLYIDSSGSIGIGTTNPSYKLDVSGDAQFSATGTRNVYITRSGGTTLFLQSSTTSVGAIIGTSTDSPLTLRTNSTNRLSIGSSGGLGFGSSYYATDPGLNNVIIQGNIGIGTTEPGAKLDIKDNDYEDFITLDRTENANVDQKIYISPSYVTAGETALDFNIGTGNQVLRLTESGNVGIGTVTPGTARLAIMGGNVGIGTTSPLAKLHVKTSNVAYSWTPVVGTAAIFESSDANRSFITIVGENSAESELWFGDTDYQNSGRVRYEHDTDDMLFIVSNNKTVMTLQNTGNVGIGTTAPTQKLDVVGNIQFDYDLLAKPSVGFASRPRSSWALNYQYNAGGTYTTGARIELGKNDTVDGDYGSSIRFTTRTHGSAAEEAMRIINGNVGIGTTSPVAKLDVDGSISLTGTILDNGATGPSGYLMSSTGSGIDWIAPSAVGVTNSYFDGSGITLDIGSSFSLGGALTQDTRLNIGSTEALFIDYSTGYVGIGTTGPGALLDLVGTTSNIIKASHSTGGADLDIVKIYNGRNTVNDRFGISFVSATTRERANIQARNDNAGNTRGSLIFATGDGTGTTDRMTLDSNGELIFADGGDIRIDKVRARDGDGLALYDDGGNGIFVEDGGNVGIGTTNPGAKLEVTRTLTGAIDYNLKLTASAGGYPRMAFGNAADSIAGIINRTNSAADLYFGETADTGKYIFRSSGDTTIQGNVGIGTTNPGAKLDVNGDIQLSSSNPQIVTTSNENLYIYPNGTGRLYLSESNTFINSGGQMLLGYSNSPSAGTKLAINGNVGIGTTSPVSKLDVAGSISLTGTILDNGATGPSGYILSSTGSGIDWISQSSIGASTVPFSGITTGTNLQALMTVGTGSSLTYSGTGIINANRLAGLAYDNLPYVYNTTNTTLTRTGAGPYTLGLNLGSTNTWTASQTFNANSYFPGNGIWNTSGNVGIGTTAPSYKLEVLGSGNILNIGDTAGTSFFSVTDTLITSNLPHTFTSTGDVSMAYDLLFTNQTASYIKSNAPLYLEAGETFESNDLTLRTYNAGEVVIDSQALNIGGTLAYSQGAVSGYLLQSDASGNASWVSAVGVGGTYTASNGLTLVGGSDFQLGGTLSQLTKIDLNSNNFGFYGTGNVGIGTTGPRARLEVNGTTYLGGATYFGSGLVGILSQLGNNPLIDTNGAFSLLIRTSGTERMRITSTGNVGIGTTGPVQKLHVAGNIKTTGDIFMTGKHYLWPDASGAYIDEFSGTGIKLVALNSDPIVFNQSGSELVRITSAGNVGIGTTGPSSLLHVLADVADSDYPTATFENNNAAGGTRVKIIADGAHDALIQFVTDEDGTAQNWAIGVDGSDSDKLKIGSNWELANITGLVIDTNGNVGIGTTSPSSELQVAGSTPEIRIGDGGAEDTSLAFLGNSQNFHIALDDTTDDLTFGSGVVVGTTPRMVIENNGNVGIGTTAPTQKLHVAGSVRVTGGYYDTSGDVGGSTQLLSSTGSGTNWIAASAVGVTYAQTLAEVYAEDGNAIQMTAGHGDIRFYNDSSAEMLFLDESSGNVGIGTTNPGYKLELTGGASNSFVAVNSPGGVGNRFGYLFNTGNFGSISTDPLGSNGMRISRLDGGPIQFGKNSNANFASQTFSPQVTIDNAGNVGIGTTNPGEKLDVLNGTVRAVDSSATNYSSLGVYGISLKANGTGGFKPITVVSNDGLGFGTNNVANRMVITNTSLVGIGTTAPTHKLEILGSGNILNIGDTAGTSLFSVTDTQITSNLPHTFTSAGDVSIAYDLYFTNQSSSKIESYGPFSIIAGESFEDNTLTLKTYNSGQVVIDSYKLNIGGTLYYPQGAVSGYLLQSDASGNASWISAVGVGGTYTVSNGLTLVGGSDFQLGGTLSQLTKINQNSNNFGFYGTGNVGIGTTEPNHKLDVSGGIYSSSYLDVEGINWIRLGGSQAFSNNSTFLYIGDGSSFSSGIYARTDYKAASGYHILPYANEGSNLGNSTHYFGASYVKNGFFSGNVGIGTTNPGVPLSISKPVIASTYQALVRLEDTLTQADTSTGIDWRNTQYSWDQGRLAVIRSSSSSNFHMAFSTAVAGSLNERMRIQSDGNVGIGTTAPGVKLDILGSSATTFSALRLTNTANTTGALSRLSFSSVSSSANTVEIDAVKNTAGSAATSLYFKTHSGSAWNTGQLALNYTGNVGIGTTAPGAKLDVSGDIRIGGSTTENSIKFYGMSGDNPGGYNTTVIAERLWGASDVSELVFFKGNDPAVSPGPDRIRYDAVGGHVFQVGNNRYWNPTVEGTTAMVINAVANVGIGTTSPTQKLHISGNMRLTGAFYDKNNAAGSSGQVLSSTVTGTDWINASGVGVTYAQTLAEVYAEDGNVVQMTAGHGDIRFYNDSSSEMLFLDESSGYIGVGTSSPNAKLDIGSGHAAASNLSYSTGAPIMVSRFDGPQPFETDYTGNPNGNLGQTSTTSGGIIYRPGKFGKSIQAAEATTNYVINSSFDHGTNLQGWASGVTGATATQYNGSSVYGTYSEKLTGDGNYAVVYQDVAVTNGIAYTLSWYAKQLGSSGSAYMRITAGGVDTNVPLNTSGSWTRQSFSFTPNATGNARIHFYFSGVNDNFLIDGLQFEQKAYISPYCDGSLGNGHSWSGTAHASTSSRTVTSIQYPNLISRESFTILGWFSSSVGEGTTGPTIGSFIRVGNYYGNPGINIMRWGSTTSTTAYYRDYNDPSWTSTRSQDIDYTNEDDWFFLALSYTGSSFKYYAGRADGTWLGGSSITIGDGFGTGSRLTLHMGTSHSKNIKIDDLAVFDSGLSDEEIYSIFKSGAPITTNDQSSTITAREILPVDSKIILARTAGNVGIGTTEPVGKLNINTGLTGITTNVSAMANGTMSFANLASSNAVPALLGRSNDHAGLYLGSGTNNGNTYGDMLFNVRENDNTDFSALTSAAFKFQRFGTDLVTILRNGNVGIGTASPGFQLHVKDLSGNTVIRNEYSGGNIRSDWIAMSDSIALNAYNDGTSQYVPYNITSSTFKVKVGTAGGTEGLYINTNGNVGIGTVGPSYKLHVNGNLGATNTYFTSTRLGGEWDIKIDSTNLSFQEVGVATRVTFQSGGNVGIGTATPGAYKLNVTGGNIYGSASLILGGDATIGGGDITISKSGTDSDIIFPAQTNDPGYIKHYENNNTARMWFSVSDDAGTTDYFGFGYSGNNETVKIYSGGNIYALGNVDVDGTLYFDAANADGNIDMDNFRIEDLGDPNSGDDAMDRDYADTRYINVGESGESLADYSIPADKNARYVYDFNRIENPSFENSLTGWSASSTALRTYGEANGYIQHGHYCAQISSGGTLTSRAFPTGQNGVEPLVITGQALGTGADATVSVRVYYALGTTSEFITPGTEDAYVTLGSVAVGAWTTPTFTYDWSPPASARWASLVFVITSGTSICADRVAVVPDRFVKTTGDAISGELTISGDVGIGTTNPDTKLHIYQPSLYEGLKIEALNYASILIKKVGGTKTSYISQYNDLGLAFGADGATWGAGGADLIILNNGNVGIGTTNPGEKLQVAGNVEANRFYGTDSTTYYLDPNDNGSAVLQGSISIGIGATTPNVELHVGGDTPQIRIGDAGAEDTSIIFDGNAQDYHIGLDDTNDSLHIGLGSALGTTDYLTINSVGNVGIGTAGPTSKLDVDGNIAVRGINGYGLRTYQGSDAGWQIGFATGASTLFTKSLITYGQHITYDSPATSGFAVGVYGGSSGFEIRGSDATAYFRGSVGIGTTAPGAYKLYVAGGIYGTSISGLPRKTFSFSYTNNAYYYLIAHLPTSSGGTGDAIMIETTGIENSTKGKGKLKVALGQRDGFWYRKSYDGGNPRVHVRVYRAADNSSNVYVHLPSPSYTTGEVLYYQFGWTPGVTLYDNPTPTTSVPTGTLIFDSNNEGTYPINDPISVGPGNFTGTVTATLFSGSGASLTSIPKGALANTGTLSFDWADSEVVNDLTINSTKKITSSVNGASYFRGGDDAELWDVNVANTVGIYGVQNATVGSLKLGSGGGIISGYSGNIGIGTLVPASKLSVGGAGSSSYAIYAGGSTIGLYATGTTGIQATGTSYAGYFTGRGYFEGNVGIGDATPTYKLDVNGTGRFTGDLTVGGNIYWGTKSVWLSTWLDQSVKTTSNPTFNNITLNGYVQNYKTWGLQARTQGLMFLAEGNVSTGSTSVIFSSTTIIMNPAAGSYIRLSSGTYTLNNWDYLWTYIPPTVARSGTYTPTVTAWSDGDRNYDHRDRVVVCQRSPSIDKVLCRYFGARNTGYFYDLAEYFYSREPLVPGEVVVITEEKQPGQMSAAIGLSDSESDHRVAGIVSVEPGFTLGTKFENEPGYYQISLQGQVPIIVTDENGIIKPGDPLANSGLVKGAATKPDRAGATVAKALDYFNPAEMSCTDVDSYNDISWPLEDGDNEQKTCYTLPNGTHVSKVMSFVNVSWYDPDVYLTDLGQVQADYNVSPEALESLGYSEYLNEIETAQYQLNDTLGQPVTRLAQFAKLATAKLEAGLISTKNLIADNIVTKKTISEEIETTTLSPIGEISDTIVVDGKLKINDSLEAESIGTTTLTAQNLQAQEATISTLYADNIISKEGNFSTIMTDKITALRDEVKTIIENSLNNPSDPDDLLTTDLGQQVEEWAINIASDSAQMVGNLDLTGDLVIGGQLTILGQAQFDNIYTTGTFTTGQIALRDNFIETTNADLYIQPSQIGTIHLLGDTMIIADTGNIIINADVNISGNITAQNASFAGSLMANTIEAVDASISGTLTADTVKASNFQVATASATTIAEGGFANLATTSAQLETNATAGVATLPTGKTELVIYNDKITQDSMVYLTPNGSTQNQVVYVKNKVIGTQTETATDSATATPSATTASYFTIAIDQPLPDNLDINWWIIN